MIKLVASVYNKTKLVTTYYLKSVLVTTPYKKAKIQSVIINRSILAFTTGLFFTYKPFVENLTLQEIRSFEYFKNLIDTSDISQQLEKLFEKNTSDSYTVSDESERVVEYKRIFDDLSNVTDPRIFTIYKNLSDFVSASDTINILNIFSTNLFYDDVTATDDFNGAAVLGDDQSIQFIKSTVNIVTWSDNLFRQVDYSRNLTDTFEVQEIKSVGYYKPLTNEFVASDTLLKAINFKRTFEDATTYSDLTTIVVVYSRLFLDGTDLTDTSVLSYSKNLTNSFELIDVAQVQNTFFRVFSDDLSATDDFNGAAVAGDDQSVIFFKHLSNYYTVADSVLKTLTFSRSFEDSTEILDLKILATQKSLSNSFVTTDSFSTAINYFRVLDNLYSVSETLAISTQFNRVFVSEFSNSDYTNILSTKALDNSTQLTDTFSVVNSFSRNLSSNLGVTDNLDGEATVGDDQNLVIFKNLFSSVQLTDELVPLIFYSNELQDLESITDYLSYSINKRITDSSVFGDQLLRAVNYTRIFSDNFKALDLPSKGLGKNSYEYVNFSHDPLKFTTFKNLQDTSIIQDVLQSSKIYKRTFVNNLSVTDDINGALQLGDENVVSVFKNITDVITFSDLDPLIVERKGISNFAGISDLPQKLNTKRFANQITQSDQFLKVVQFNRVFFEITRVLDTVVISKNYIRRPQETVNSSDNSLKTINKNLFETINVLEALTIGNVFDKDLVSVLGVTDDLNGALVTGDQSEITLVKVLDNSYSTQDLISVGTDLIKTDVTQLADLNPVFEISTNKLEVLQISDNLQKQVSTLRSFEFNTTAADTASVSLNPNRSETVNINQLSTKTFNKNIFDSLTVEDIMSIGGTYYVILENLTNITDDLNGAAVLGDDQSIQFFKAFSNQTALQDNLFYISNSKNLTELINFNQLLNINYAKLKIENLTVSEEFSLSKFFIRTFTNNTNYSDSIFLKNFYKNISNYTNISESGVLNIQNYAGYYFEEDYVGQSVDIST